MLAEEKEKDKQRYEQAIRIMNTFRLGDHSGNCPVCHRPKKLLPDRFDITTGRIIFSNVWRPDCSCSLKDYCITEQINTPEYYSHIEKAEAYIEKIDYYQAYYSYIEASKICYNGTLAQQGLVNINERLRSLENSAEGYYQRAYRHQFIENYRFPEISSFFYNEALKKNPNYAEVYEARSILYSKKGWGIDELRKDYQKFIQLRPLSNAKEYYRRGFKYQQEQHFHLAIVNYEKAHKLAPSDIDVCMALGRLYLNYVSFYHTDKAIECFNAVIQIDPNNKDAYVNRILCYNSNQTDEKIVDYTSIIRLDPKDAKAYFERGKLFKDSGKIKQAIDDFTFAISLDKSKANYYTLRGKLYDQNKDYVNALSDYDNAIILKPNNREVEDLRKKLFENKPLYNKSIKHFELAIKKDPNNNELKKQLQKVKDLKQQPKPRPEPPNRNFIQIFCRFFRYISIACSILSIIQILRNCSENGRLDFAIAFWLIIITQIPFWVIYRSEEDSRPKKWIAMVVGALICWAIYGANSPELSDIMVPFIALNLGAYIIAMVFPKKPYYRY